MVWRDKSLHYPLAVWAIESHWMLWRGKSLASATATSILWSSTSLPVAVFNNRVLGRKANVRERKLWNNGAEYIMRNCIIGTFT